MSPITPEIIAEAKRLREECGWGWQKIAHRLCISLDKMRRGIEPEYAARRNAVNQRATATRRARTKVAVEQKRVAKAAARQKREVKAPAPKKNYYVSHPTIDTLGYFTTISIPERVLFDRERRLSLSHPSFTAEWQGDPLPGYSALDRRRQA